MTLLSSYLGSAGLLLSGRVWATSAITMDLKLGGCFLLIIV